MTRLFIELYLDEDVDVLIADLVQAKGFRVETTQKAGELGAGDEPQLQYAISQQKTLLTHNRVDFENIAQQYFVAGRMHLGVIIAVRRLLTILNHVTADEMHNQLRYI